MPEGVLGELPFQVLQQLPAGTSSRLRYLVRPFTHCASRNAETPRERPRREVRHSALWLLQPCYPGAKRPRGSGQVHGDEKLARCLKPKDRSTECEKLYGPRESTVYIGADAREERVKQEAGRYKVLQLLLTESS